jgi:SAM-dependent methyltransferase
MHPKPTVSPSAPRTHSDLRPQEWHYPGHELEFMEFAVNYRRWILDRLRPYLGHRIVEVGGGTGAFSQLLLGTHPEALTVLEPSTNMFPVLAQRLAAIDPGGSARAQQCTLDQALMRFPEISNADSILYINVLEHIEDDEQELRTVYSALAPAGRVLIFSPAMRWLMGKVDRQMGHFRRYHRDELTRKCLSAGFQIRVATYVDLLGVLPWWVRYCLLKSNRMEDKSVRLYDRCVVPLARVLESAITPPCGKNVLVIAEK